MEDLKDAREEIASVLSMDKRFEMQNAYSNAETAAKELPLKQPDIVIMDINLPGMNGIDCIKKVKNTCPHTQFIMFTVYENDENVFDALEAGASGYLLKKTPMQKIVDSLIELHQGGAPMSMQIARKVIEKMHGNKTTGQIEALTFRENEVLHCLAKGLLYKEVANKLNITIGTVRQHIHNIYKKLHVQNRTEALNKLLRK
ncbi:MAG TPA: response regulator transcription factor [Puia sp.]|nr:response regulator transcription factor [Puia sp.]